MAKGSVNVVILIGRLGRDPELRHTSGGTPVCNLGIATTDGFGERETTNWHNIVVWGKQAENCKEYLAKGRQVQVTGTLQYRKYEDKDGVERNVAEVTAREVQFLGSKSENEKTAPASEENTSPVSHDDIPF
jgi:single-strand DNA-binding protein